MNISEKDLVSQREHKNEKMTVREWLGEFLDVEIIDPKVLKRLELLNHLTSFIEEEQGSIEYAKILFEYYKERCPEKAFSEEEKEVATIGLIMADIGKTGPPSANESQQAVIIRLFGIEGIRDVKTPVRDFLRTTFPETSARDIELLQQMNVDPSMPIEKFWRLHSQWTLQIIEGSGVPERDLPGAALHHILEGDNADLINEQGSYKSVVRDGEVKQRFGDNHRFDRPEKLVVLLDKYTAFLKRIKDMTHKKAIEKLRETLVRNQKYATDTQFLELIEDLAEALKDTDENTT